MIRMLFGVVLAALALGASGAQPVAIDVGHYLAKPGATSAYGVPEFEYNQSLAAVIAARLEADGVPVRLIGFRGEMEDLYARAPQAEEAGAQFLLSIHHDSVKAELQQPWIWNGREQRYSTYASGFSLFVSRKNPRLAESLACASAIGAALRAAGLKPTAHHAEVASGIGRPWADETNGVYYYDDMRLSVETEPGKWTDLPLPNGGFESENLSPWQQTAQGVPVRVLGATATLHSQHPFEGKQCLRIENKFLRK
mgnify:CR=1 FL=1